MMEALSDRLRKGPLALDEGRRLSVMIGRALAEAHEAGLTHGYLSASCVRLVDGEPTVIGFSRRPAYRDPARDVADFVALVARLIVTDDRVLRAELAAWSERAMACKTREAVQSLEHVLFPDGLDDGAPERSNLPRGAVPITPRRREGLDLAVFDASPRTVFLVTAFSILLVAFAGAMAMRGRDGETFLFRARRRMTPVAALAPERRVPLDPVAVSNDNAELAACPDKYVQDPDLAAHDRAFRCVRAVLYPRLYGSMPPHQRASLRLACAALHDYGCVLRVDALDTEP